MGVEPGRARYVLASRNRKKLEELRALTGDVPAEFVSAAEAGAPEVEETGDTFEANAVLKANAVARATGLPAIADDSGLVVDALGGEPGVRSSRYSAEGTDAANTAKLLAELRVRGLVRPAARFVCVIALAEPGGAVATFRGEVEGEILDEPRGTAGFGYDPVFYCPALGKAFGEATPAEKASTSHRARALAKLLDHLMKAR